MSYFFMSFLEFSELKAVLEADDSESIMCYQLQITKIYENFHISEPIQTKLPKSTLKQLYIETR